MKPCSVSRLPFVLLLAATLLGDPATASIPEARSGHKPAETYSVVVHRVPAQELLFALGRDAGIDVDIHPAINGVVSLNAQNQTFPQLLTRISRQVGIRHEFDGDTLFVLPDTPYFRNYSVEYVNLARDATSTVSLASQIGANTGASASSPGSGSSARIANVSNNRFWTSLVGSINAILEAGISSGACVSSPSEKPHSPGAPQDCITNTAGSGKSLVKAHPESGVISVKATRQQHALVHDLIEKALSSAQRQVMIEAAIAEVELTHDYQQGIDWRALNLADTGLRLVQRSVGVFTGNHPTPTTELSYESGRGNFSGAVRLLEAFGNVKVLSSPKLAVLNNHTAVMKIVDDNIYFTYDIKETDPTSTLPGKTSINSTLHSVPVGLVLTITPMIGSDGAVTLNIRPSMSRVIGQKIDPSLQLAHGDTTLTNAIPVIRAREFDSVMRIANGNIAIMGGLMEDDRLANEAGVPGLSSIKGLGALFKSTARSSRKTELVVFIRPTVLTTVVRSDDAPGTGDSLPDPLALN